MEKQSEFTQFGRYLLLQKIAEGGMAEIFLAKQGGLAGFEKLVVIKRILPGLAADPEFVTMFLDEGRLAASMMHANIVQVFDLDRVEDGLYIAMEYVPGQDFSHVLRACRRASRRLPAGLLARILASTCQGLHYAHTLKDPHGSPLGIVHRDVTPSNILVAYEGAVKVLDFGVARAATQHAKTSAGKVKGKFSYLAPEQVRMEPIDARVDVWALGVVLWEALTGRRLFSADNELAILRNILEMPVPTPASLAPETPPDLGAIAMRALQRDRAQRYPNTRAMQIDLERFIATQKTPATTMDVSTFMKQLFADEFAAYERLLRQSPNATPHELASLAQQAEPGKDPSHSGASDLASNPTIPIPTRWTPARSTPARSTPARSTPAVSGSAVSNSGASNSGVSNSGVSNSGVSSSDVSGSDVSGSAVPTPELSTPPSPAPRPPRHHRLAAVAAGVLVAGTLAAVAGMRLGRAHEPVAAANGSITIVTVPPEARVSIDGAQPRLSPVTISGGDDDGEHVIVVEKDGYESSTQSFTLAPRTHRQVLVQLTQRMVSMTVTSKPSGARLLRADSGELLGLTPVQTNVPTSAEPLVLRLELDKYRSVQRTVSLKSDVTLEVALAPLAAPTRPASRQRKPRQEVTTDGVIDPFKP